MKSIVTIFNCFCLFLVSSVVFGQDVNQYDMKRVKIQVVSPRGLEKQSNVADLLENRLAQAVTLNGTGTSCSRFLLVCQVQELNCLVASSTPPQYVTELEITCYLADQIEKTILQQTTFQVKGVAKSKEKAVMNAVGSIQARHPQLKKFLAKGKEKIINYYRTECEQLMKRIESDIRRERYEEAILQLLSIPDVDSECVSRSIELKEQIDEEQRKQIIEYLESMKLVDIEWVKNKDI